MAGKSSLEQVGALQLDRVAALHGEAFTPLGERAWTRQDVAELLAAPGVTGLLLQEEGRDIGMALWRIAADESELLTIAVRPAWRRRGAGRKLLSAVIDHARAASARVLFLEVGMDNAAARALYEAAGFVAVGQRPAYYHRADGPPADAIVMRLNLS